MSTQNIPFFNKKVALNCSKSAAVGLSQGTQIEAAVIYICIFFS